MSDEHSLLELAITAARLGGGLLLERAGRGAERTVAAKSTPTDLVSEADLASQRAIHELLSGRRPEDGFLGEEEGTDEPGSSGLRWIVDPLDGTINFLFGIPQWCVSVAVADADGVIAGAVFDPNRDELFTATHGGPALLRTAAGEVELHGRSSDPHDGDGGAAGGLASAPHSAAGAAAGGGLVGAPQGVAGAAAGGELASAMIATGLAYDVRVRGTQARVLAELIPRVRDVRRFGSAALDLCWTAAGRFDGYFERSVKPWDIAAGELVCRRAGLETIELGATAGLPSGILAARAGLAAELHAIVG